MEKKTKLCGIVFLVLVLFSMTSCIMDLFVVSEDAYKKTLSVSDQQVWTRNKYTTKVSESYISYSGTHNVNAFFYILEEPHYYSIGSGKLNDGILDFTVSSNITASALLGWEYFKEFFSNWDDLKINNQATSNSAMGNMLLLEAHTQGSSIGGMIDRQRIVGDGPVLSCETLLYFYLNEDCTITGIPGTGARDGNYYYMTENYLNLSLKEGWNLVCRKEAYSTDILGYATISMEIKEKIEDPNSFKWVIEKGFRL